ncbi:MAG: type II toxin-antitoxin system RelE/ParE family toxin [Planctomycetota bacterium]|nr:MAG: type II toxin-antitoxin system RelE/ParE family toxin [Planctomycetota bacterium]
MHDDQRVRAPTHPRGAAAHHARRTGAQARRRTRQRRSDRHHAGVLGEEAPRSARAPRSQARVTALRIRPQADRDTDQAADFYAREADIDVALRFLAAVDQAYQRLVEHPHVGTPVKAFEPRLAELRFWPVPGFESYLVFYVPSPGVVEVVRVLHGARDLRRFFEAQDPTRQSPTQ